MYRSNIKTFRGHGSVYCILCTEISFSFLLDVTSFLCDVTGLVSKPSSEVAQDGEDLGQE